MAKRGEKKKEVMRLYLYSLEVPKKRGEDAIRRRERGNWPPLNLASAD